MMRKRKTEIPGIGMRIIKSAMAVAVCYLINMLRQDQGMVFYSQLAALWCIQMYRSNTKQNAIQRTIGTVVGALYGLVYLLLNQFGFSGSNHSEFIGNMIISAMIIAVGIFINDIRLCFHPKRDTLFISGLDGLLLNDKEKLSDFSKVELNRMIDSGMKFTLSTMRTPASL